jgi:hypothetical protein
MTTRTWWFEDTETGEEFFVENDFEDRKDAKTHARKIAEKYFESPRLVAQITLTQPKQWGMILIQVKTRFKIEFSFGMHECFMLAWARRPRTLCAGAAEFATPCMNGIKSCDLHACGMHA